MITIRFQETLLRVEQNASLQEVLLKQGYEEGCFAATVNRHFVPRHRYASVVLEENDLIEIIIPMQGG